LQRPSVDENTRGDTEGDDIGKSRTRCRTG
jgi:hypothetical protein